MFECTGKFLNYFRICPKGQADGHPVEERTRSEGEGGDGQGRGRGRGRGRRGFFRRYYRRGPRQLVNSDGDGAQESAGPQNES